MARFCENCGGSLNDTAKFCASCGEKVSAGSVRPEEPQTHTKRTSKKKIKERKKGNGAYVRWYLFYFFFFPLLIPINIITTIIAFTKGAEKLWRKVTGVRPLRLRSEKERLLPLFKEVYLGAAEADPDISKGIKLYIKEDMTINAFAFGRSTLVLTRGSLELLDDVCLKGLELMRIYSTGYHRETSDGLSAFMSGFLRKTKIQSA